MGPDLSVMSDLIRVSTPIGVLPTLRLNPSIDFIKPILQMLLTEWDFSFPRFATNSIPAPSRRSRSMRSFEPADEPYIVAGSPVPMPAGWLAQFDRNNKRYFFVNTNVNPPETTWTDPRGVELYAPETQTESVEDLMAQVKATKAEADALNAARAPKVFVPQPVPQAPKPVQVPYQAGATGVAPTEVPLPAGWLKGKQTQSLMREFVWQIQQTDNLSVFQSSTKPAATFTLLTRTRTRPRSPGTTLAPPRLKGPRPNPRLLPLLPLLLLLVSCHPVFLSAHLLCSTDRTLLPTLTSNLRDRPIHRSRPRPYSRLRSPCRCSSRCCCSHRRGSCSCGC